MKRYDYVAALLADSADRYHPDRVAHCRKVLRKLVREAVMLTNEYPLGSPGESLCRSKGKRIARELVPAPSKKRGRK